MSVAAERIKARYSKQTPSMARTFSEMCVCHPPHSRLQRTSQRATAGAAQHNSIHDTQER